MDYNSRTLKGLHDFILSNKELMAIDLIQGLKEHLGEKFIDHLFQLNTPCHVIIFKDEDNKTAVLKLERNQNPTTTQKEVIWYSYLRDNNIQSPHIPAFFGGYQDGEVAFYFLEYLDSYIPAGTLFLQSKATTEELISLAKEAVNTVEDIFQRLPRKKDPAIVRDVFLGRLEKRFSEMYDHDYLREMLSQKEIVINGKSYKNLPYFVDLLRNSPIIKEIEDRELGIIHGDMHFGNILLKKEEPFKFLDPNGALFLPLEYDYGKILYSTQSGYDFLHAGMYKLKEIKGEYEFALDESEKRQEITNNYTKFLGSRATTVYYTNTIHTLSSIPHHAKDIEETKATYLQTIIILGKLFKETL